MMMIDDVATVLTVSQVVTTGAGRLSSKERELRLVEKRHVDELSSVRRQSDEQSEQTQQQHRFTLAKVPCLLHFNINFGFL